jgi:hypothetical protein
MKGCDTTILGKAGQGSHGGRRRWCRPGKEWGGGQGGRENLGEVSARSMTR